MKDLMIQIQEEKKKNFNDITSLKNVRKYDWVYISANINLELETIESVDYPFHHLFDYSGIVNNPNLTLEFVQKHLDKFQEYFPQLLPNKIITQNFIELNLDKISYSIIHFSSNPNLDIDFIIKYHNVLDWNLVSQNSGITMSNEKNMSLKWNRSGILKNPNLTFDFIVKYYNVLNWKLFSQNRELQRLTKKTYH